MSLLRKTYLVLAIWGFVHPMWFLMSHVQEAGLSLAALVGAWTVNSASTALSWDLLIAGTVFVIWAVAETRVRRNWFCLWSIPATLLVGLSFGLPLYLFLRTIPAKQAL